MKTQVLLAAILCVSVGSITSGQEKPKTGTERESVDARFAAIAEKITRLEIHLNENAAATRKMASAINNLSLQLATSDSVQNSLTEPERKSTELAKKASELDQANNALDKDKPKAMESRAKVPARRSLPSNSESANSVKTSTRYSRASNCRVEPGIGLDALEKIMQEVEKLTVNCDVDDNNDREKNDVSRGAIRLNESSRRLNDSSSSYRLNGSSYRLSGSSYRLNDSYDRLNGSYYRSNNSYYRVPIQMFMTPQYRRTSSSMYVAPMVSPSYFMMDYLVPAATSSSAIYLNQSDPYFNDR